MNLTDTASKLEWVKRELGTEIAIPHPGLITILPQTDLELAYLELNTNTGEKKSRARELAVIKAFGKRIIGFYASRNRGIYLTLGSNDSVLVHEMAHHAVNIVSPGASNSEEIAREVEKRFVSSRLWRAKLTNFIKNGS